MADSSHKRRLGVWSKISDGIFDEIAARMDNSSAYNLAACCRELYRQVKNAEGSRCPNAGCRKLVSYHEVHYHKIACPHGPCTCTDAGCEFAAPPAALLAHLTEAHSMAVRSFRYGKEVSYTSQPMPPLGSPRVDSIGPGDDGTVFAVQLCTHYKYIVISVVCVRSAACLSPRYSVKLRVDLRYYDHGGVLSSLAKFEPANSTAPGTVLFGELKSALPVHRRYMDGRELSEIQLHYSLCIDKIPE